MPEKPSAEMAQQCLAVRLRRMNRAVTAIYDDAVRPLGVKVSQLNVLAVADRLGDAVPSDVGRILHLDASTLSRNLERIKRRGWIEYLTSKTDGRLQPFRLTASGRKLLREAYPLWKQAQGDAEDLLGKSAVAAILSTPAASLSPE